MTTLLIMLAAVVLNFVLAAACLQLGARWVGSQRATFSRALLATLTITAVSLGVQLAALPFDALPAAASAVLALGLLGISWLVSWELIRRFFQVTLAKAVLAWLTSQIATVVMVLFALLVLIPFISEAFRTPTNAMAPSVLGDHYRGVCPHCGGDSIVSTTALNNALEDETEFRGICTRCLQTGETAVSDEMHSGDRFAVDKLLTPRRWDMVAYRYPEQPSQIFIHRLVGLPGETVSVRDGQVWINGVAAELPEHLRGLRYVSQMPDIGELPHGTERKPLQLGDNEYCVLGDNSERSSDSRFWGAVPGENLIGVATVIYWPPSRWTVWR
jgi:signal peptidase I